MKEMFVRNIGIVVIVIWEGSMSEELVAAASSEDLVKTVALGGDGPDGPVDGHQGETEVGGVGVGQGSVPGSGWTSKEADGDATGKSDQGVVGEISDEDLHCF